MPGDSSDFGAPSSPGRLDSPTSPVWPSWGPWASFGGTVLGALASGATQLLVVISVLVVRQWTLPHGEGMPQGLASALVFLGSILGALMALAVVALLIGGRGWPIGGYLAWQLPTTRATALALASLALILAASLGLALALDRPIVSPTLPDATRGVPLGLVILAVGVAAPLAEEVLFRGFLFRGLAESRLGPGSAIGLSALAWAGFQALQVTPANLYSLACVYLFGLFLGLVRYLSASLPLAVAVHALAAAVALAEAIVLSG